MLLAIPLAGEIEGIASDLFPYRYPISIFCIGIAFVIALFAYRRGVHMVLWRHRLLTTIIGTPLLVAAIVAGDYLLSPLWERSSLDEASPVIMAVTATDTSMLAPAGAVQAAFQPSVRHAGEFMGADSFHFARGKAQLIETEPGRFVIRFEDFSVRNGPDLYVYLSTGPTGGVDESLNLGRLKATDGAFNYEVEAHVDVSKVTTVLVWCKQFSTLFGSARLQMV